MTAYKDSLTDLAETVDQWGEAHAVVDEHDQELELRRGPTEFDFENGLIYVEGPTHEVTIPMDRIVSWYAPSELWH